MERVGGPDEVALAGRGEKMKEKIGSFDAEAMRFGLVGCEGAH